LDDGLRALKVRCRAIALSLFGVAVLSACAPAPVKPERMARGDYAYVKEYVSWLIAGEMKQHKVTGLSIALVDDQRVVWAQGFGYADKQRNIPADPDTVYRLGSISKLFTAMAAMQLAEQGRMDIDRPLADYLPGFSIRSSFAPLAAITPRNIMTHHSGLPVDYLKGMWSRKPVPFADLKKQIRDQYVASPPGQVFAYSNIGMTLLGDAVSQVGGEEFSAYVNRQLFVPLGMSRSSFTARAEAPGLSKAYRNGQEEAEEFGLRDVPAGGLNLSVLDMSRFMAMLFDGGRADGRRIVAADTIAEMWRPQNEGVPLDLNFRVGLAWMLGGLGGMDIQGGGPVAHHAGGTVNFNSQLIVLPRHKLGVVVLSNTGGSSVVVNRIATEAIKAALEAKTGIRQPPEDEAIGGASELPAETLQSYVGTYATLVGPVKVSYEGGRLQARGGNVSFRLVPGADGRLRLQYRLLGLMAIDIGDLGRVGISREQIAGHDVLVGHTHDQEMLVGERLSPTPLPAPLAAYLGEYEAVNFPPDEMYIIKGLRLAFEDGILIAEVAQAPAFATVSRFALQPVADDVATVAGLGRQGGETVRFATAADGRHLYFEGLDLRMTSGR
jgi:CubicO group peptidase (beta-lactamase class C family)